MTLPPEGTGTRKNMHPVTGKNVHPVTPDEGASLETSKLSLYIYFSDSTWHPYQRKLVYISKMVYCSFT
jgi:hypothetical protein